MHDTGYIIIYCGIVIRDKLRGAPLHCMMMSDNKLITQGVNCW